MVVYLSIGSNLGNSLSILRASLAEIEKRLGTILQASSIYVTQAWGKTNQNDFLNQVVAVEVKETSYCKKNYQKKCYNILQTVNEIEAFFGRKRAERWGPRTLDIDILFVRNYIITSKNLIIPHKEIPNRRFVLAPLNEIMPDIVHPVTKLTIKAMLDSCCDQSDIKILSSK